MLAQLTVLAVCGSSCPAFIAVMIILCGVSKLVLLKAPSGPFCAADQMLGCRATRPSYCSSRADGTRKERDIGSMTYIKLSIKHQQPSGRVDSYPKCISSQADDEVADSEGDFASWNE